MKLTHSYSSLKMYSNCPKRYFHERIEKRVKDEGNEITRYGERVHKSLENRLNGQQSVMSDETRRYEAMCAVVEAKAAGGVLTTEEEMTLNEKLEPTGWFSKDAWLRSKIDVLIRKGSMAVMLDWKTGKRRPDFDQLELFAAQVMKHYPEVERVKTCFVWLKDDKIDSETYTREGEHELWERILAKIKRVEYSAQNDSWPAKPSGLCNWCPCKSFCEYA